MSVTVAERPLDVSALWRAARYPAALTVLALALITILAAIGRAPNSTPLDPRNANANGARALAALLTDRGVAVSVATSLPQLASTSDTTILLADPGEISDRAYAAISKSASTVLIVDPFSNELTALGVDVTPDAVIPATTLEPSCRLPAAVTAGSAQISGDLYAVPPSVTACYRQGNDAALVETTRANGATTFVLGSGATLSNGELAQQGDAALALGLLNTSVVKWVPGGLSAGPPPRGQRGLANLLPSRLLWATLQLFIALVVFALWRARRLGQPVVEPLPVVVRAAETVEGRARLLHAARARGSAARSLRSAAVRRLSHLLRLGPDEDPAAVAALVAERSQLPATEIHTLLYGGEPADDASLVRLAQQLPRLESAIRRDDAAPPGGQQ
jgi:hypothetical protein